MKIFQDKERNSLEYLYVGEGTVEFLDRSGFDWAEDVRNYLNDWVEKYPDSEVKELIIRMKEDIDSPHYELFIHELFLQMGFEMHVHPTLPDSGNKPDFIAIKENLETYVEARLVTETTDEERLTEKRRKNILDGINSNVKSKNFFISIVDLILKDTSGSSLKNLYRKMKAHLDDQDPDVIEYIYQSKGIHSVQGHFTYEDEHLFLKIGLIPKSKEYRNTEGDRIIGVSGSDAKFMDTAEAIRTRVKKKSGKYGELEKALILGLNITSPFGLYLDDVSDALYGSGVYNLSSKITSRKNNGIFGSPQKPMHTRISGILISNVHHMTINKSIAKYFRNPYAKNPFSLDGLLDEYTFKNDKIEVIEGQPLNKYINALSHWL